MDQTLLLSCLGGYYAVTTAEDEAEITWEMDETGDEGPACRL